MTRKEDQNGCVYFQLEREKQHAMISLKYLVFLLIKCVLSKQIYPEYVKNYFQLISTIDQPLSLRKYYRMQQSAIDFYNGTMNLILSVPHDGDLSSNLPKRPRTACRKITSSSKKCYYQNPCLSSQYKLDRKVCPISHGRDLNTRLLALAVRYELNEFFQLKPYVIINRLERSKVDMNRFIDEGTFNVRESMHAWMRYHFYLKHARELIVRNPWNIDGKGLLFDLHSQQHQQNWIELGYLISSRQLARDKYYLNTSSLSSYLARLFSPKEIIIGEKSLGYFLTKYQYLATPSPNFPSPPEQSYYEWGYTIEEHGRTGNFSAIMIESPAKELHNLTKLYFYAKALASAIREYIIEIELFEALIPPVDIQEKQRCNSSRQLHIQISIFLLLFFSII